MKAIMRTVVVALLGVWCFPAVSLAQPEPASPPPLPALVTSTAAPGASATRTAGNAETARLAAREKQAQNLQDYKGGEGVYIYMGSGVLLVAVIILLLLLL